MTLGFCAAYLARGIAWLMRECSPQPIKASRIILHLHMNQPLSSRHCPSNSTLLFFFSASRCVKPRQHVLNIGAPFNCDVDRDRRIPDDTCGGHEPPEPVFRHYAVLSLKFVRVFGFSKEPTTIATAERT